MPDHAVEEFVKEDMASAFRMGRGPQSGRVTISWIIATFRDQTGDGLGTALAKMRGVYPACNPTDEVTDDQALEMLGKMLGYPAKF